MSDAGRADWLSAKPARGYALVSAAFVATRLALHLLGLRMNFALEWMWVADPTDLRTRFWHTILYFHAMPPGMNTITAFCLKLGGAHPESVALLVFEAFGLWLANALFGLGRAVGLSARVAVGLALAFSLTPPALYFDHLYIYEAPVTALLTSAALLFVRAVRVPSLARLLACFTAAVLMALTRTTFHLVWFVALVALTAWLMPRARLKTVLLAAAGPALVLVALYAKNYALYGLFDAFSEGPVSLNLVTTRQLPRAERDAWIAQGKLSAYAAIDVFAGPRAYLPFFASAENPKYPPELSLLEKPTSGAPNYNHWFYVEVMPVRKRDAFAVVRERPLLYLDTVRRGLMDFFSPTTLWHPHDQRGHGVSPHAEHRALLGGYERFYNALLHTFPFAPVGVYLFVPVLLVWAFQRARALGRSDAEGDRALAAFLWFALFQIGYVVAASTLFTYQEESRYRYQIEPLLWLLSALALGRLAARRRA
jgi:hypothetical protein